jgi:hypothetical protein
VKTAFPRLMLRIMCPFPQFNLVIWFRP